MTNKITLKKSSVADKVPLTGDLEYGELALNYADGNLFYKNSSNAISTLASNKFVSVTGNITGGNVNAAGLSLSGNVLSEINSTSNIVTTGNISGNYFVGNGSMLTGITTTPTSIVNGNSNVSIDTAAANVTIGVNGYANSVVIGVNALTLGGTLSTPRTVNSNVQTAEGVNSMLIGPVTIGPLGNIFIPTDSSLIILQ